MLTQLFISFFKIGTFTIGGGFAMIPLMQREIVERHHWISQEEFLDLISLSQSMPGVFAVNMAASIGWRLKGIRGAAAAIIGNILVPVLIILGCAICFRQLREFPVVDHIFMGLRPAVAALIAAPVFNMAKSARLTWSSCWIPIAAALLICLLGVSPVVVILGAIAGGLAYHYLCKKSS